MILQRLSTVSKGKTMKIFFLIILFGVMINTNANTTKSESELVKMDTIADQLSLNFSKKMKEKFGFDLLGMGGGGFHDFNALSMHFNSPNVLELSEARILILEVVSEFLNSINSDKNIKPYLRNYPFDASNIRFLIGFTKNNQYPIEGKVAFIGFSYGKINYATFDHENDRLKNIFRETYDEALQIVLKENNSDNANSSSTNPDLPSS
jgi:hypothetical protein